jgi:hypothetical protein
MKDARAVCDRCGFIYDHSKLTNQVKAGVVTGLLVCPGCLDKDHPQQFVGRNFVPEYLAVRNPRPKDFAGDWAVGFDPVPTYTVFVTTGKVWAV